MNKKSSLLALAALLVAGAMYSCGDDADVTADTTGANETDAQQTEAVTEGAEKHFSDGIAKADFGGADYRILTSNIIAGYELPTTINYAEEETGEIVNDTLFARDRWMEETFNVNMAYTLDDGMNPSQILKSIQAGDDLYDMILGDLAEVARTLAANGAIYSLNDLPELKLTEEYWFPELNEEIKIGDTQYFVNCPISPRYWGSVYLIMFNRELVENMDLGNFYDMVNEGKWTIDKMDELCRAVCSDLDGDGKIGDNDRFGMINGSEDAIVLGSDYHFVENNGGSMHVTLDDPGMIDLMHRISDIFDQDHTVLWGWTPGIDPENAFNNGNYLFYTPCAFELADFRDLPYDYGILPSPKMDEAQKEYYVFSQPWVGTTAMIPVTLVGEALSRSATLTDAMAAYGYDYVRPAVFENVIQLKGTRDEQSAQIIDKIYENVKIDLSIILRFGKLRETYQTYLTTKNNKQDIVSAYASIKDATYAEIESLIEIYTENRERLSE